MRIKRVGFYFGKVQRIGTVNSNREPANSAGKAGKGAERFIASIASLFSRSNLLVSKILVLRTVPSRSITIATRTLPS